MGVGVGGGRGLGSGWGWVEGVGWGEGKGEKRDGRKRLVVLSLRAFAGVGCISFGSFYSLVEPPKIRWRVGWVGLGRLGVLLKSSSVE